MHLKQIALIASSFFFSCHLLAATYAPENLEPFNTTPYLFDSTLGNSIDNIFNLEFIGAQDADTKRTQEYMAISDLLNKKQIKTATERIQKLIQQYPQESDFYNLLAVSDLLKKDYPSAIKNYQKAIELSPYNIRSHIGIATVYLQMGEITQAKQAATRALSVDNNLVATYLVLADVAYKGENPQEAEDMLKMAEKKAKGNDFQEIKVALMLVNYYKLQKQPKNSLRVAENVAKNHPYNPLALSLLAKTQIYNNQQDQAILTLEKIIKQESKDAEHRLLLAQLLLKYPGKKQKILQLLNEAQAILPKNVYLKVQIIPILTKLELFSQALGVSKKIKELAPKSGFSEALNGAIYQANNKPDMALAAFQNSYQIKPSAETLASIIKIMSTQGKQATALAFLEKEVKKDSSNLIAHLLMGDIYLQQNKNKKAEKHYLSVLAKEPSNVVVLNNLAWVYNQENNPKALDLIKRAYKISPTAADILDTYATILVKQGKLVEGIEMFASSSKLEPSNYNIQYHLASAYALNKQNKQAVQILQNITRFNHAFPEKEAAVLLLKKLENK